VSTSPIKVTAKPVPGSPAFVGMASRFGQHVCSCGHPAGHLHPEDAIECVRAMVADLVVDVIAGLTSRVNSARFVA
jgi:hypothetical protein